MGRGSKTVILVSGGLDSYIAWRICDDPNKVALWVDLGQPYAEKEKEALALSGVPHDTITLRGFTPDTTDIDNWIIPGRNLLLVTLAASRGTDIWLSALAGEMHKFAKERDKTPEFYHLSSGLLTYVFDIQQDETRVVTPFQYITKTGAVSLALSRGISTEELKLTSSCYHPLHRNCGECGTCFKRWIAMVNNGIDEEYHTSPWTGKYAKATIAGVVEAHRTQDFSHYSRDRVEETLKAMETIS